MHGNGLERFRCVFVFFLHINVLLNKKGVESDYQTSVCFFFGTTVTLLIYLRSVSLHHSRQDSRRRRRDLPLHLESAGPISEHSKDGGAPRPKLPLFYLSQTTSFASSSRKVLEAQSQCLGR
jgi:hypothetical protein